MRLGAVVLDCADQDALADFYARLLGWQKTRHDDEWAVVAGKPGEGTPLCFSR